MDSGDLYNPLKAVFDFVKVKKTEIDTNFVFLLHRRFTVIFITILMVCINLFFFGMTSYMDCISPAPSTINHKTFAIYCWTQGTFIVVNRLNSKVGVEVMYPGIGTMISQTETISYQISYSLLHPFLFYLLVVFKLPWWIWKDNLERGRLRSLMDELESGYLNTPKIPTRKKLIVSYFVVNLHNHQGYAFKYIVCELLNLFNVFLQMWLTDYFLQGEFSTYGLQVLQIMNEDSEYRVDPMAKIFPKVSKCVINISGPSGNIQPLEGICVLPLNNLLEKIFVGLWFWFVGLAIFSCLAIVYRFLTIYIPSLRYWLLRICSKADPEKLRQICTRCYYGDWFILFSLKNVLDSWLVDEIFEEFADKLLQLEG